MVMLDMAARVLSKFMARDYSPATAALDGARANNSDF
jgi:hypothetical protein